MRLPMRFRTIPQILAGLLLAGAAAAADRLDRYPAADAAQISVSGLSSGAFMASQLHIAHSSRIMGIGMVAGGLYGCAVETVGEAGVTADAIRGTTICMRAPDLQRDVATYAARIREFAARGWIDAVENLPRSRLYAFTGKSDRVVDPRTVENAVALYGLLGLPALTGFSDREIDAGHAWVTREVSPSCNLTAPPYINGCNHDQSGQLLSTIYGPLEAGRPRLPGRIASFDQTEFAPDGGAHLNGLWHTGYLFVPAACGAAGAGCRLHIVLHGCLQSAELLGDRFVTGIGMNEWADANRIIVLYPQARAILPNDVPRSGPMRAFASNELGCWNFFGYAGDTRFPFKDGKQLGAIWAMVQRIIGE